MQENKLSGLGRLNGKVAVITGASKRILGSTHGPDPLWHRELSQSSETQGQQHGEGVQVPRRYRGTG
jgi:hypothetical protein